MLPKNYFFVSKYLFIKYFPHTSHLYMYLFFSKPFFPWVFIFICSKISKTSLYCHYCIYTYFHNIDYYLFYTFFFHIFLYSFCAYSIKFLVFIGFIKPQLFLYFSLLFAKFKVNYAILVALAFLLFL